MKRILLIGLTAVILLSSCRSMTSFESPNSFRNITGTLFLTNGKSVDGKLVVQTDNFFGSPVKIYTEGDKKPMQFNLGDVEGYRIRNDYYHLKEVKGGMRLGKQFSFMKRLTPEGSRIHLYEHMDKVSVNDNKTTITRYETEYYMQLLNEEGSAVYPLSGSKFVPNFNEKMSKMVSDCFSLAQKIAAKENGYFYAQVSLFKEKRVEVLMNIIEEYNRCK
jgi:hypothetical protein